MYLLTNSDRNILFRTDRYDSIEKLTMLKPETIVILKEFGVEVIKDLVRLPLYDRSISKSFSDEELSKLQAIIAHIFNGAYDNLHG